MQSEERPPIRLDQFLKQRGAVGTGGHAKVVIQAGEVTLNGAIETRRSKQLSPGDIVAYAGEQWCVE
ncbi:MAG: RNA-binding S4 domain-containing protein [Planctomycetes bacterium]|nr:RNA-binding S4 domain-containing protein [Planctomycetota bacterium]MCH9725876.1 RNA-binding S4 domain-containing protein [Planctomycetota bacterium]MCH9777029.1 RNA-binding S4 domain-containing protein [Planctomycetota bacterium]MCH9789750.1 RNA-binding S4 domain-containing protein [Planctomycetota bacterium]MDF1742446.1 RNA-binding S4 domain-containing protein [Gimesia sp.]